MFTALRDRVRKPKSRAAGTPAPGHGLPAGVAEVEMIERLRNRRSWSETLPPSGDRCYGERRIRLIESIERQEWVVREQEISQIQVSPPPGWQRALVNGWWRRHVSRNGLSQKVIPCECRVLGVCVSAGHRL